MIDVEKSLVLRMVQEVLNLDGGAEPGEPSIAWRNWAGLSSDARNKYVDVVNCAGELEKLKRHSTAHPEAHFAEEVSTKHDALVAHLVRLGG